MASGSYSIRIWHTGIGYETLRINWSESYNSTTKKHRVTITSVEISEGAVTGYPTGTISINNTVVFDMYAYQGYYYLNTNTGQRTLTYNGSTATGYVDIDGSTSSAVNITISVGGNYESDTEYGVAFYAGTSRYSGFFKGSSTVATIYTLSTSAGTGSTITVNRTTAAVNSGTGVLSNGSKIYRGDVLTITITANTNYTLISKTVNNKDFTSGNTYTVTSNVAVVATARPLSSDVAATDSNIGSVSTITITRYSTDYYHTLQYSFGDLSGYIKADGSVQGAEVKINAVSVAFAVPTDFYAEIPSAKTGTCTITCTTYANSSATTALGTAKTCTFTVTAAETNCSPTVNGTVVDTNATTVALTGDPNTLVRYKSAATCTITATARQSSTIASRKIQNQTPNSNNVLTVSGDSLSSGSFSFSATCSRGYTTTASVSKTLVAYIKLTLNPVVYRPAPTTGEIALTLSGNYYGGSFGAYSNTLTIRYRYRETTVSTWSSWITVAANKYSKTSRAYSTSNPILLADSNGSTTGFDYQKSYYFQIQAYDGANGTTLTSVSNTVTVQRGIPVFDWGESDFNFNVPVKIDGINLIDIFYPVGSVYMTANTSLPSPLSSYGTWTSVSTGISGINGWQRTA